MSSRWKDTAVIYILLVTLFVYAIVGSVRTDSPSVTDGKECAQSDS